MPVMSMMVDARVAVDAPHGHLKRLAVLVQALSGVATVSEALLSVALQPQHPLVQLSS